ncbi:condensin-2 complex subunit D3 [Telopea speciosissima]|uniref:condensin-2 complex subunit D3 n=1 Tax=Telopea speciosissima TaxID=54955 RepID=UPI001CC7C7FB|nr:condensin-2 complex subunit D3 [Telopea speciosissima]
MEEGIHRIIAELEADHNGNDPASATCISESTLLELQALFDNTNTLDADGDVSDDIDYIWEALASKNISPTVLVRQITTAMDSGPIHLTLLASQVYLFILLSPNSPVFTLFSPIAFISLLRSIRRSLKQQQSGSPPIAAADDGRGGARKVGRKRKGRVQGEASHNMSMANDYAAGGDDENNENVQNRLFAVLEKLESVMGRIHLDRFPESLKSLIQTVAQIPVMALESYQSSANYNRLTNICFRILNAVLKPEHGDQTTAAVEVLKSLSPAILLLKSQARTSAMNFVTHQMMTLAKGSDAVRKAVIYLPRYLVQKAPEKSEPRACAVESIMDIVRAMEYEDQIGFADYVVKMTQGKSQLRLLAVDLIPILLMSLSDPLGENAGEGVRDLWGLKCMEALIQRCSDAVPGIRARALTNLAQVVGFFSGDVGRKARLEEVMGFVNEHKNLGSGMKNLLRKRCMDEKAAVRKAALLLITKSTSLMGKSVDEVLLKTMGRACSDPLVSIRKMAISALSEVFRKFTDGSVITEWLQSVPCLITDNESSIQEECENLFLELVLDRVSKVGSLGLSYTKNHYSTSEVKKKSLEREIDLVFPEGVLILLKGICDGEVTPNVKKICVSLGKKKRLKPAIAISLQNIIRTSESLWLSHSMPIQKWTAPPGAWLLLAEVSAFLPKAVDWEFLHHHWQLLDQIVSEGEIHSPLVRGDVDEEGNWIESNPAAWACDRVFLLQTISNVSLELPQEPAANLAHNLLKRIEKFNMHSTEVNAHVKALRTLCKQKALNKEEGDALVLKWVQLLLSEALKILETYIEGASEANKHNIFVTPPTSVGRTGKRRATASRSLLKAVTALYTIGSLVMVCPSADLNGIIPILHTIITSRNSEPKLRKLPGPTISIKQTAPSLYIQSWLTMGKICLADATLAKRYIPLFVQELEKSDCAALRNNIIVIMADFCVHYTALVDCYIPKITNCLCDPCEVVRRQTFILLSRLSQRDYVKWRGVLFLRFLLSLVDESEKIRQLADFLFGNILKAKAPLLAYNSFVEAIFVLNDCHAHSGHSESQSSQSDRRLFSIRGHDEKSRSQRMQIYIALLKQMAPEHLLATSAKLCSEILAAASDGLLNLEDVTGQAVLQDALQILACKEMRIQSNRGSATDTTEMDEESGAALAAVRGKVAIQAVKKSLIQNAIPIFIELKRLLESKNSPLTGCLMECLRVLLKDYKNEIEDMLIADKQLQKELIYDIQKYEAAKAKSTVAEAVSTMQRSNGYSTPTGHAYAVSKHANQTDVHEMLAEKLGNALKVSSVMADMAAEATARSVLREVNQGVASPSLQSISMPKLKSSRVGTASRGDRPSDVLESLRRRQSFDSDEEN